jgi:tRNA synthetases class II (D, K and N)
MPSPGGSGGFAIGLERFTARLVGASNIRQVTTFPRDIKRLALLGSSNLYAARLVGRYDVDGSKGRPTPALAVATSWWSLRPQ